MRSAFLAAFVSSARAFVRGTRGGAAIGLALGVSALISTALLGFDLYSRIKAGSTAGRMAVTMAEYVSREAAPEGAQIDALAQFLREQELGLPADVVYVISVIREPAGADPATVSWVDTVRFGDTTKTGTMAGSCGRFGAEGGAATLSADFTMAEREVVVIVEVCAQLRREGSFTGLIAGDVYRLYVLPARDSDLASAKPTRPDPDDDDSTAFLLIDPPAAGRFDGVRAGPSDALRTRHGPAA